MGWDGVEGREEWRVAGCHLCCSRQAVVFCPAHAARLCLQCDNALHHHHHHHHHSRAALCDSCNAAAAHFRCSVLVSVSLSDNGHGDGGRRVTLCRPCAAPAPSQTWAPVTAYTGCPTPEEMMHLLSADAPSAHNHFHGWLAHRLLFDDDHQDDAGPPEQFPSAAVANGFRDGTSASASAATIAAAQPQPQPPLVGGLNPNPNPNPNLMPPPPTTTTLSLQQQHHQPQPQQHEQVRVLELDSAAAPCSNHNNTVQINTSTSINNRQQQMMPLLPTVQDHLMMISNDIEKKREDRNRAKLRYIHKKKRRKFCKQIMYACRKAGADTRKRVKGRFAKASSFSSCHDHPDHRL